MKVILNNEFLNDPGLTQIGKEVTKRATVLAIIIIIGLILGIIVAHTIYKLIEQRNVNYLTDVHFSYDDRTKLWEANNEKLNVSVIGYNLENVKNLMTNIMKTRDYGNDIYKD